MKEDSLSLSLSHARTQQQCFKIAFGKWKIHAINRYNVLTIFMIDNT